MLFRKTKQVSTLTVILGLTMALQCTQSVSEYFAPIAEFGIVEHPFSVEVNVHDTVQFEVSVVGISPFTYRWFHNDEQLLAPNKNTLTVINVTSRSIGEYFCVVENGMGIDTSDVAYLSLIGAPRIDNNPESKTIFPGDSVTFLISIDRDTLPCEYQWQKNGIDIVGATDSSYSIRNVTYGDSGSVFRCRVTNDIGWTTSLPATITVKQPFLIKSIDAGAFHLLICKEDLSLGGAGNNGYRKMLDTNTISIMYPTHIMENVVQVSAGDDFTMIVKNDGSLWAVGANHYGQLGIGSEEDQAQPVQVMDNVEMVSAGDDHTVVVKTDGTLWGFGNNWSGQLGNSEYSKVDYPVKISDSVTSVSAGYDFTLFIKNDNTLWGIGGNDQGQLGNNSKKDADEPVKISENVQSAFAGINHSAFIKIDSTLWMMGDNWIGQLGDGTKSDQINPVQVGNDAITVALGTSHSLYLSSNKEVFVAGSNFSGQLGENEIEDISVFKKSAALEDVVAITAGARFSAIALSDGTILTTGENRYGQLGNGTTEDSYTWTCIASQGSGSMCP